MAMPEIDTKEFTALLGLLGLPFLGIVTIFNFMNARYLKGGKFGLRMNYLALGFLVMGLGHLHMQISHRFQYNFFNSLLRDFGGVVALLITLVIIWSLSGLGFYQMWKASKI